VGLGFKGPGVKLWFNGRGNRRKVSWGGGTLRLSGQPAHANLGRGNFNGPANMLATFGGPKISRTQNERRYAFVLGEGGDRAILGPFYRLTRKRRVKGEKGGPGFWGAGSGIPFGRMDFGGSGCAACSIFCLHERALSAIFCLKGDFWGNAGEQPRTHPSWVRVFLLGIKWRAPGASGWALRSIEPGDGGRGRKRFSAFGGWGPQGEMSLSGIPPHNFDEAFTAPGVGADFVRAGFVGIGFFFLKNQRELLLDNAEGCGRVHLGTGGEKGFYPPNLVYGADGGRESPLGTGKDNAEEISV